MPTADVPSGANDGEQLTLWLWHYPEHHDLALLVIKRTGVGEDVEYDLREVWFHEYSCPGNRIGTRMSSFADWRESCDSAEIAKMIANEELTPIPGFEQIPQWTPGS
jgi:hypothetical protein